MAKNLPNWKQWRNKQLKDPEIRKAYEDAKIEMDIGVALAEIRKRKSSLKRKWRNFRNQ